MATIVSGDRRIESVELYRRIGQAASGFASLGLAPGSGVAMCLRNDIEFYEVSLGAGALGAYAIPLNWHLSPDEARYILDDSGASVVVIHADLLGRARSGIPENVTVLVVPTSPAVVTAFDIAQADAAVPGGEIDWNDWVAGFEPRTELPGQMPLAVFYTSGTTGRPRRPAFTSEQQSAVSRMLTIDFGLGIFDDPGKITTAVAGPVYHGHRTLTRWPRSGRARTL